MKKKVLLKGPLLTRSGYGEQARFALRALRSRPDLFDIFVEPITWGKTSWINDDSEERRFIDNACMKTVAHTQRGGSFDISVQVTIPNEWEKIAPINVGYTAGVETTLVSPEWVQKGLLMDRIITTSKHSTESYASTSYTATNKETGKVHNNFRLTTPIQEVSYSVRCAEEENLDVDFSTDFNLLTVAQWGPRKNMENTIRWFLEEFSDDENVGLIIKTNIMKNCIMDREYSLSKLKVHLDRVPDRKCKVYLLHGDLSTGQMTSLYKNPKVKGLLSLTHGEGFGLPLFEAACLGLPVIAPNWSGQVDFLNARVKDKSKKYKNKSLFTKVTHTMGPAPPQAVWDTVIQKESQWCYPDEKDSKRKMRQFYTNYDNALGKSKKLKQQIMKNFSAKKQHEKFVEQILLCGLDASPSSQKVMVFD